VFVLGRPHIESLEQMKLLAGGPNQALDLLAAGSGLDGALPRELL